MDNTVRYIETKQFKGALSDVRRFLATGSPPKVMKILLKFFILKIFKFLS